MLVSSTSVLAPAAATRGSSAVKVRATEVIERITSGYNGGDQMRNSYLLSSFEVAQEALTTMCSSPIANLTLADDRKSIHTPFPYIVALQKHLERRSAIVSTMHVPRNCVDELDGFVPYLIHTIQRRFGGAAGGGGRHPQDDSDIVDRFTGWMEIFYPQRDHRSLPFNVLMRLVESFGAYDSNHYYRTIMASATASAHHGKSDPFIEDVLGGVRPFYGIAAPSYEEMYLHRALANWVSSHRHTLASTIPTSSRPGMRQDTSFNSAIDLGSQSGVMTKLLLHARFNHILATDSDSAAILNLHENLSRDASSSSNKRRKVLGNIVFTEVREGLLPAESSEQAPTAAKIRERNNLQKSLERQGLSFERSADRRRREGRLRGGAPSSQEEMMLLGADADESFGQDDVEDDGARVDDQGIAANIFGGQQSGFHLAVFNALTPPLFSNVPWRPDDIHAYRHSNRLDSLRHIINHLQNSTSNESLLHPTNGHLAVLASNDHLLRTEGLPYQHQSSVDAMLGLSGGDENVNNHSNSGAGAIIGWEVVKREKASMAYTCRSVIPDPGNLNASPIVRLVSSSSSKSQLAKEIVDYHQNLFQELLVVKPIFSRVWKGLSVEERADLAATESQRKNAVNIFKSNDLMDFQDTYEYEHYLPRDGTKNPFGVAARNPTFSYLADEYYDEEMVQGDVEKAAGIHVRGEDGTLIRKSLIYNRNNPADATTGGVRGSASTNATMLHNRQLTGDGYTLAFDAIFNKDSRRLRQRKYGKLAVHSQASKKAYLDKVVGSDAAKLQILTELDKSDFDKQPY